VYKAFIFDFDGVLVDTTDIQVRSIVRALGRHGFDVRHPSDLDIVHSTITTKAKLVKFCDKGHISMDQVEAIYEDKKKIANDLMLELNPQHYFDKREAFQYLKEEKKNIAIVTNANGDSTRMLLEHLGLMEYLDVLITNSDVVNPKPHPEPYIRALMQLSRIGCGLEECIIFEDSAVGLEAARATGASVHEVKSWKDVGYGLVADLMRRAE
jgi:beta-phosphoglucomutase|tara:strand:+ start:2902 stop:3534 length:633 start_codon:yes stop_codon:yes gene_type:complete